MNDTKIIVLERFNSIGRAEIIKALLESNGIACSLAHATIQTVLPYLTSGVAPIELLIAQEDEQAARELLLAEVDTDDFKEQTKTKRKPRTPAK